MTDKLSQNENGERRDAAEREQNKAGAKHNDRSPSLSNERSPEKTVERIEHEELLRDVSYRNLRCAIAAFRRRPCEFTKARLYRAMANLRSASPEPPGGTRIREQHRIAI
jgi:hypothetical protein